MLEKDQIPKYIHIVGWIATITACCMYVSYVFQIIDNLYGQITPPYQPAVAAVNGALWVWYAVKIKDWPVAISNAPGIVFGAIACITAIQF